MVARLAVHLSPALAMSPSVSASTTHSPNLQAIFSTNSSVDNHKPCEIACPRPHATSDVAGFDQSGGDCCAKAPFIACDTQSSLSAFDENALHLHALIRKNKERAHPKFAQLSPLSLTRVSPCAELCRCLCCKKYESAGFAPLSGSPSSLSLLLLQFVTRSFIKSIIIATTCCWNRVSFLAPYCQADAPSTDH